ncbi:MAG: hypothetical protein CL760_00250 [Chloroflexi bacterium]|nr:hypothetical protein [Chloroflexota bacterium]|tara:strand:- start:56206 stop:57651 length:1446 start_codon:yes stop_codon:yes gene_type:complete
MKEKRRIQISSKGKDTLNIFNDKNPEPLSLVQNIDKEPRYYQINGIRKLNHFLKEGHKRLLFIMPTGTGKTLVSKLCALSTDIRETLKIDKKKKIRVLFVVHKKRLLRQAAQEFAGCPDVELITQSTYKSIPQEVIDEGWDITFIDEAHHEAMMSIQNLLDELGDIPIIGFTANPDRGDSLVIKFEKFIMPISKEEAIKEGYISEPGVNTVVDTGKIDKTDLTISLVKRYHKHMGNCIVFFRTNNECEKFFQWCIRNTLTAQWLSTESTEDMLDQALDNLSKGHIQFLINCKKVDEGIDVLNCTDVILARQFGSKAEKEQLVGRAIRPDTPCTIWEFQNPYNDSVEAVQVIGSYRFRRLLFVENRIWDDFIIEGFDDEWGLASDLRFEYIKRNLGYDPRFETEEEALIRKREQAKEDKKESPVLNSSTNNIKTKEKVKRKVKVTGRMIYEAAEDHIKPLIKTMTKEEIKELAKRLIKEGKL